VIQKRCKTTGKRVWCYTAPGQTCKKPKTLETTEIPIKQGRGEDYRDFRKRLSELGYEMSLTADKKKKGVTFNKWRRELMKLGYVVSFRVLCSANHGDPTSRRRLYVQCARLGSGKKIVWPNETHCKPDKDGKVPKGMLPWRTARDIIDFSNLGLSIMERKRPLSAKTMRRIIIGLLKFALKSFIVPQQAGGKPVKSVDEPIGAVTTRPGEGIAVPVLLPQFMVPKDAGWDGVNTKSVDEPVSTITTQHRGEGLAQPLLQPCLVQQQGQSTAHTIDAPLNTVLQGPKHFLLNSALIKIKGTGTANSADLPLDTVAAGDMHHALMQAFMMVTDQQGSNGSCVYDKDTPIKTVITKANQAMVNTSMEPVIIQTVHGVDAKNKEFEHTRVKSLDTPLGTVHASGGSYGVMAPFLVPQFGECAKQAPRTHSIDEPVPSVTGHGAGALTTGKLEAFIVPTAHAGGEERAQSVDEPLPVVCGNRGDAALVSGFLRPFTPGQPLPKGPNTDLVVSVLEPLAAELGKTKFAIEGLSPWLYVFYSNGAVGSAIDSPVPTVRTHDSVGLCYPVLEFDGKFFLLDIYFRMLTPRELARAQGFRDDFVFPVTKTKAVSAIGNAVSRNTAMALVLAVVSQDPDVGKHIKDWK